ncbi:sialate O-acetylesterase [Pseudomonas alliivorans]|nr:sialate O-acetylesterase [Pseudomonas alliivorans]MEE5136212.1 sialate O-acetylesterase [Pseudomonas alliivorans]
MSVQSGPTDKRYAANGVTTIYAVPFLVIEAGDLKVYLNGVLITSGYTQSGVGLPTSSVTFATAPTGDLYFVLEVPFQRLADYQENGDFLAATVNRDFDRIWQALKQLFRFNGRALTLGASDVDGSGAYRAKGNRIADLADPINAQDAATKNWATKLIANLLQTGQGPVNNAKNVIYANKSNVISTVADALDSLEPFTHIYDVLVVYGQSNALGLAGSMGDTSGFPTMLPTSLMYDPDTGTIKPLIQNMKSVNGSMSSGHAWGEFANEYYRRTKRGVIVVNAARGGMPIASLVKGAGTGYYETMVNGAKAAVIAAGNAGLTVGNKMVCWHQGESDQSPDGAAPGTSYTTYYTALFNLIENLSADFPFSFFGICTVGCPPSRPETSWSEVQNAQRTLAQRRANTAIVFDGCPTFSVEDGIINPSRSDEHYSQQGYNLMGFHAARSFAELFSNAGRVKSSVDLNEYGGSGKVGANWARAERVSGMVFYHTSGWRLSSKDLSLNEFRTAGVVSVVPNAAGNALRVKLANRADFMFETYVKVNQVGVRNGVTAVIQKQGAGDDYFLDITFYVDLRIAANLANGNLFYGRPLVGLPTWLSSFVTAGLTSGVLTITHGGSGLVPQVSHCGGPDGFSGQPAPVSLTTPNNTQTRVSFGTGAQPAYPLALVSIDKVLVPISSLALLDSFTFEFGATIAPLS